MEIQAAIVLIIVFFLLLAFSVPVSFSIISASLVTLIMFLTPHFGVFISAQKMVTWTAFRHRNCRYGPRTACQCHHQIRKSR